MPRRLRRYFLGNAKMLTRLCRAIRDAVVEFYRTGLGRPHATPGLIAHLQSFGEKLNPHVHVHVIATDGAFDDEGLSNKIPV